MTEERIKELIYKNGLMSLEEIGKMVATEARKEGIEELCNSLSDRLRRGPQAGVALIVEDEAERLKEKVK